MASLSCHAKAVTKQVRLERIVRPNGTRTAGAKEQPAESRSARAQAEDAARKRPLGREPGREPTAARTTGRNREPSQARIRAPEPGRSGAAKKPGAREEEDCSKAAKPRTLFKGLTPELSRAARETQSTETIKRSRLERIVRAQSPGEQHDGSRANSLHTKLRVAMQLGGVARAGGR